MPQESARCATAKLRQQEVSATQFPLAEGAPEALTFQPDVYDEVLKRLPKGVGLSILDLGSGRGHLSYRLAALGHQVEACDYSKENFACPNIRFLQADLSIELPIESNHYDVVISVEVIEHIENHFRFMHEALRVLKPGGTLILTTPNVLSLPSRWHYFWYGFTDCQPIPLDPHRRDYFMQHINPISLPELLFHIERNGAQLKGLYTNRLRNSAWGLMLLCYPFLWLMIRRKLLRSRYREERKLFRRHIGWMLSRANLMGRITIAVSHKHTAEPGSEAP